MTTKTRPISRKIFFLIAVWACPTLLGQELYEKDFKTIMDSYTFIGDFRQKEAEREITNGYFFKYPLLIPKPDLSLDFNFGMTDADFPATQGDERATAHLNAARQLFKNKDYENARKTLLSARYRYGGSYPAHRRTDYFLGLTYLQISKKILEDFGRDIHRDEVRLSFSNAATFFAWAFIKKKDVKDDFLDQITPRGLYNLAVLYLQFGRHAGAHAAAEQGLDFLRSSGRGDFRPQLRNLLVETWILDHNYLKAMQELDTLIRQDPNPKATAPAFARAADIYFDLANYELAEEVYQLANRIFIFADQVDPHTYLLRGESLFWLGRFEEAIQMFELAFEADNSRKKIKNISRNQRSWAKLRMADARLALFNSAKEGQNRKVLFEKAQLAYFQVGHEFPGTEAQKIARVRQACISLPHYKGNNIKHARADLARLRTQNLPMQAIELSWACEIDSYAKTDKSLGFIAKVQEFYDKFPRSNFIKNFVKPITNIRADKIDEYFAQNDDHSAIKFYEARKDLLFKNLSPKRRAKLFLSYVRTFSSDKAKSFWSDFAKWDKDPSHKMWGSLFLIEMADLDAKGPWRNLLQDWLTKNGLDLDLSPANIEIWHRIWSHRFDKSLASLLLAITNKWGKADSQTICTYKSSLISRLIGEGYDLSELEKEVNQDMDLLFPKIFTTNMSCAYNLLDLEFKIASEAKTQDRYAKKWLDRLNWPFKRIAIPFIWEAQQILAKNQMNAESDRLLNILTKLDPKQFEESTFAKLKADKGAGEVESFWKK